jgi:hypothetical protein
MSRPTTNQIATAVQRLAAEGITNRRIADIFAGILPAGYTLVIQEPHHSLPRRWVVSGMNQDLTTWQTREPVAKGRGVQIITRLVLAAWDHATDAGNIGATVADTRAYAAANPLPVCPECGRTVLPHESAISSHPGHHRDCC